MAKTPKIPLFSLTEGFGELSITGSPPGGPHSKGSAGLWAIAGTSTEVTNLKAAGPTQTAAVVAYGGAEVSAIAAEIDPGNTHGSVAYLFGQGSQTGLTAETGNGFGVVGVSGFGGVGIQGRNSGGQGWAAQFLGNTLVSGPFIVNGTIEAGNTSIHGNLSVLGTLTVNAVPLADLSDQVAALQAQVQALAGLPNAVSTLQGQVASLQKSVNGLAGVSADIFKLKGQIQDLQNQISDINAQLSSLQNQIDALKSP